MKKRVFGIIFLAIIFAIVLPAIGENGDEGISFEATYGAGEHEDCGYSVQQTADGGYIIAGKTWSYGAGEEDVYLIKTDSYGNEEWGKTFGGASRDCGYSVQQTKDSGYIIAGATSSYGAGAGDVYLIKTDPHGNKEWEKTFGGASYDWGSSVQQTADGGYIIAGNTYSYGAGERDVYLIKTDPYGNKEWEKTFGGADWDSGYSVQQTKDGGYIIAGNTLSYGAGEEDVYLIKTDPHGNKEWGKTFGGADCEYGLSVQQTADGGYIIAGKTYSYRVWDSDVYLIKVKGENMEPPNVTSGHLVTSDLWIRAVIQTEEKGPIEAVWQKGGEDTTSRGDRVIWGHFYASPSDVTWGSQDNPDLFVKIWFDHYGRLDVNFFHVSVPDIVVYSDYPYDGTPDEHGITTMDRRYIRQYYENNQSYSDEQTEDGNPPSGYSPAGNPSGYSTINDLRIGAIINTVEKGPIDGVWRLGGQDTTARGDQVVWGHFYASPSDVTWGSENNPDLFIKVWFDVSGRVDVNFFHVSVPDIEVYSDLPSDGTYDQKSTTIMDNRYIRHEYWR